MIPRRDGRSGHKILLTYDNIGIGAEITGLRRHEDGVYLIRLEPDPEQM